MKKLINDPFNRLAAYAALILVSSLPFSLDAYAESGNEKKTSNQPVSTSVAVITTKQQDEETAGDAR